MQDFLEDIRSSWGYEILLTLFTIVGAIVLIWVVKRIIRHWSQRATKRWEESHHHEDREQGQRMRTITDVLGLALTLTVWVVAGLTIMAIWGIPMGPLVALGAAFGVALGLGAQDLVRDVIGGLFILIEDQYSVGDVVSIGGVSGAVEEITLRTTVLRDLEGIQHHVPNGAVRVSSNYTQGFSRALADIPVSYDTDLDQAIAVIKDEASAMRNDDDWADKFLDDPVVLGVNELSGSSVDIRLLLTTITEERWNVEREFLKRIKQRFDREGIEIPYQYVNVVDRSGGSDS